MSLHEHIVEEMHRHIEQFRDCASLMPSALASVAYDKFSTGNEEPHVQYGCLEHFKNIGRKVLAGCFSDDGENNPAYSAQGELFSGHLQDRYPLPRKRGEEPQYKLRHLLTPEERAWNVALLRKSAEGRLSHADALEAEGLQDAAA